MLRGVFAARLYPFYKKHWKVEPYLTAGYSWASNAVGKRQIH